MSLVLTLTYMSKISSTRRQLSSSLSKMRNRACSFETVSSWQIRTSIVARSLAFTIPVCRKSTRWKRHSSRFRPVESCLGVCLCASARKSGRVKESKLSDCPPWLIWLAPAGKAAEAAPRGLHSMLSRERSAERSARAAVLARMLSALNDTQRRSTQATFSDRRASPCVFNTARSQADDCVASVAGESSAAAVLSSSREEPRDCSALAGEVQPGASDVRYGLPASPLRLLEDARP
mmetsp:Transcript_19174/g.33278  ORF Transcript_19174/g.33278 Transcript_19174/m.33278 type:complete len:235 (+) Transcript_19174:1256-1960(+)